MTTMGHVGPSLGALGDIPALRAGFKNAPRACRQQVSTKQWVKSHQWSQSEIPRFRNSHQEILIGRLTIRWFLAGAQYKKT